MRTSGHALTLINPLPHGIVLLLGIGLAGCDAAAERGSVAVRDSAGVRIVEGLPTGATNEGLHPSPIVTIGWGDAGPLLQDVSAGAFLEDGRFAVADRGARRVYLLSASGELEAELGGPGEGPGEFQTILALTSLGADTVLVQDYRNARISVFAGGDLVGERRFEAVYGPAMFSVLMRQEDGRLVAFPTQFALPEDRTPGWMSYPLLETDSELQVADTLAMLAGHYWPDQDDDNPIRHAAVIVNAGGALVYARTDRPEVWWMDADAALVQISRWMAPERLADEETWERYETIVRMQAVDIDPTALEDYLAVNRRDYGGLLPYFGTVQGDGVGRVWLGRYKIMELASSEYLVLSADADRVHHVRFSRPVRILDASRDRVLAVAQDDLDVQAVVLYELGGPEAERGSGG